MFGEEDLLPISALQHLLFCPRQCALIHVERQWSENRLTVEGRHLHEKAHGGGPESRGCVRIARGVALQSLRLGLFGVADVVEFHHAGHPDGRCPGQPFPVEYKRGKPKTHDSDRVQLCAQALCLEEMLNASVPCGALFYGQTRRREDVAFSEELRALTERTAAGLHTLMTSHAIPTAEKTTKCKACSMLEICLPGAVGPERSVKRFTAHGFAPTCEPPQENAVQ